MSARRDEMEVREIICPSGLKGVIRKLKVSDLDIFADRNLMKQGGPAMESELADRVWMETKDRGPYVFGGTNPPWSGDVLHGDRFYAIMQARMLTKGDDYEFDVQCDNSSCRNRFRWGISLSDLPVVMLSKESREQLAMENRFSSTLEVSGHTVFWALPTGSVQRRVDKYVKKSGVAISSVYAARLLGVEGMENVDFLEYMKELNISDFDQLTYEMERADCGVDTGIEVECPSCGNVIEQDVGFGRDFFTRDFSRTRSTAVRGKQR
jgi:hypothetical protein